MNIGKRANVISQETITWIIYGALIAAAILGVVLIVKKFT